MQAVFISVMQVLAALVTAKVGVYVIKDATSRGLALAAGRLPVNAGRAVKDVLDIFYSIVGGLVTVPVAILKLVIIAIIELPVKVLWATVPGLKTVMDAPSISKIFS